MSATKKTRDKAPALVVPQSIEETDRLIRDYGMHTRALAAIDAKLARVSAKIKAAAEAAAAPHEAAKVLLFERIQAFADARRTELTQGKSKSVERPAGTIGWRVDPPSVKIKSKHTIKGIIAWLRHSSFRRRFLRTKYELDKEAMLKSPAKAGKVPGIQIVSDVEQFYIEPTQLKLAERV